MVQFELAGQPAITRVLSAAFTHCRPCVPIGSSLSWRTQTPKSGKCGIMGLRKVNIGDARVDVGIEF